MGYLFPQGHNITLLGVETHSSVFNPLFETLRVFLYCDAVLYGLNGVI